MLQEGKEELVKKLTALLNKTPRLIESELYDIALKTGGEETFHTLMHLAIKRLTQHLQAYSYWACCCC